MAQPVPWAVLLCKFKDRPEDPPIPRTTFERLFTSAGTGTWNVLRYFADVSHGAIDLGGSRVFGWFTVDANHFDYTPPADTKGWTQIVGRGELISRAKKAAQAGGVDLDAFYGVVACFNVAIGGSWGGGREVGCDFRFVQDNGTEVLGHEMAHAMGLGHSRRGAINLPEGEMYDYEDPWDVMSARRTHSAPDPDYTLRGPGLNAANMRAMGWLDQPRVWRGPESGFDEIVTLRPLHRRDLEGPVCAEFPPVGSGHLVEFRARADWDAGIPRPAVLIHRFNGSHSYLLSSTGGVQDLVKGDVFDPTGAKPSFQPLSRAEVVSVDGATLTAQLRLRHRPASTWSSLGGHDIRSIVVNANADGRLELFALGGDGAVYHRWQNLPNGGWGDWHSLAGEDLKQLAVGRNFDGRLELFALGGDSTVYHRWQTAPNGDWDTWRSLAGQDLRQITVANNADGRLELFALGGDRAVYHRWQVAPNGGWDNWQPLGGHDLQQLDLARNADGRLELFALGADGAVYQRWQTAPNGGWEDWRTLAGHDLRELAIGSNADGRLEVFALGGDGATYHRWQTTPNGGWGDWRTLAGHDLRSLALASNVDGRLELLAIGGDRSIYHRWQTVANGGWSDWHSVGGSNLQQIAVGRNADGRLELFVLGGDAAVYHMWQGV